MSRLGRLTYGQVWLATGLALVEGLMSVARARVWAKVHWGHEHEMGSTLNFKGMVERASVWSAISGAKNGDIFIPQREMIA